MITSVQNEKIKNLKKLLNDKTYLFLDNPKLVEEAVGVGHTLEFVLCTEKYNGKIDYGGEILLVSDSVFNLFSSTKTSQGIIGVVKFNQRTLKKPEGNFLVLDEVQDPGNVGTLLRSALGAEFNEVYLLNSCKLTNDKVVRSSMGALFKLKLYECDKIEFISTFKTWNKQLYIADMKGENIFKTKYSLPIGVAVGNEGNGISKDIRNISSGVMSIPINQSLESLNVGVAGSIIMYKIKNQEW